MPAASSFGGSVRVPTSSGRPIVTRSLPPVPVKASGPPAQSHSGAMFGHMRTVSPPTQARVASPAPARSGSPTATVRVTEGRLLGALSRLMTSNFSTSPNFLSGRQGGLYDNLYIQPDSMPFKPAFGKAGFRAQSIPIPSAQRLPGMSLGTYQNIHGFQAYPGRGLGRSRNYKIGRLEQGAQV